jgi:DNA-binding transcriptional LysR family regulator
MGHTSAQRRAETRLERRRSLPRARAQAQPSCEVPRMDRWVLHEAFLRTAETGSLSRAARDLKLTQPAISKRLLRLEAEVGVRLLDRGSRGVRLTDAGAQYLEVVRRVRSELEEAETMLAGSRRGVSGTLRLSFPVALGETWLTRLSLRFHERHPSTRLQVTMSDRIVDLVEDAVDVAVRIGTVTNQSVSARPLGRYGFSLVATPRYLATHGTPKNCEALARRRFFSYFGGIETFTLPSGETRSFAPKNGVQLPNTRAILTAVLEHAGIARIATWGVAEYLERGELVQVLPELEAETSVVHAVYLPSRYVPERVRQYVAFLAAELPRLPGWVPPPR